MKLLRIINVTELRGDPFEVYQCGNILHIYINEINDIIPMVMVHNPMVAIPINLNNTQRL